MDTNTITTGDTFEVLPTLEENSIHACVTDPPYALGDSGFMGKDWDNFSDPKTYQKWCETWATECLRVLKPGGHLLAFGGNTRHHRLFSGVEDAGFEIRDTITWHYGSGFPKALDVSKAIDKAAGIKPDRVEDSQQSGLWSDDSDWNDCYNREIYEENTTDAAKQWDGWKTALKPATEYVILARKPFDSTVAECMQTHGTAALNIDETRIDAKNRPKRVVRGDRHGGTPAYDFGGANADGTTNEGRYPSNVVFDETQAEELDKEVGETTSHSGQSWSDQTVAATQDVYGDYDGNRTVHSFDDSGGPSRYFYTSKASKSERTLDGKIDNAHPTVKPQDLMEWLIKLVTAEGQIVLDPFTGSGTTCMAAKELNREFIGIEQNPEYADIARVRVGLTPNDPSVVRADDAQNGLEDFQ